MQIPDSQPDGDTPLKKVPNRHQIKVSRSVSSQRQAPCGYPTVSRVVTNH
jgi:hypothetical protein